MRAKKEVMDQVDTALGPHTRNEFITRSTLEMFIDIRDLLAERFSVERKRMENIGEAFVAIDEEGNVMKEGEKE